MEYLIIVVCLTLSALFSGLTLGLMTLDVHTLRRKVRVGDAQATRILPVRERGNQLLTTLLLGNVAVNAVLAVFLGSLVSGVTASLLATGLIFFFGEILPQAVFSRYAMRLGAYSAPFVSALMRVSSPVTLPIAWMLDKLLGEELPKLYSKHEIMELISEHEDSAESPIDQDEERIIHGALKFSHKTARDVMTPWNQVAFFYDDRAVNEILIAEIQREAYSRYPVVRRKDGVVSGVLFAKDVLFADEGVLVRDIADLEVMSVRDTRLLDVVLQRMLKKHKHLAVVRDEAQHPVGVITLEDIMEEVLQQEILDEDDDEYLEIQDASLKQHI